MSIYQQPNKWQCGPFALKHALLMLGVSAEESEITRIARSSREGADEVELARAASKFRCDLPMVRRLHPDRARRDLLLYLRRGIPVLMCIFEWGHWVTIVKEEKGKFIMLDSSDRAVLLVLPWSQLKKEWVFHRKDAYDEQAVHTLYDFHPVVPRFPVQRLTRFSVAGVKFLRRPENRIISHRWNEYVTDVLDLCKPRTARRGRSLTLGEFLRRHEAMILDQVSHWHGQVERQEARRVLRGLRFVADTLGLVIPEAAERRAIAAVSVILTLWAEGEADSDPIYSARRKERRN
ncbi:MAG: hypothetical protein O7H41_08240 [Planctomycetota bacterium]|nr:hypothetical protein [Planctomycetota bacterium]